MEPFANGDRIILEKPLCGIPSGTIGTVVSFYPSPPELYQVRFDGNDEEQLVPGHLLVNAQPFEERYAHEVSS
jgi:hypothetical protein